MVALILLFLMTIAAAGGTIAWLTGIVGTAQEDTNEQLRTDVVLHDVQCFDAGGAGADTMTWTIRNAGEVAVDGNAFDVLVYNGTNGPLQGVDTQFGGSQATIADYGGPADNVLGPDVIFRTPSPQPIEGDGNSINLEAGKQYRIVFEFTNDDVSVEDGCQAG